MQGVCRICYECLVSHAVSRVKTNALGNLWKLAISLKLEVYKLDCSNNILCKHDNEVIKTYTLNIVIYKVDSSKNILCKHDNEGVKIFKISSMYLESISYVHRTCDIIALCLDMLCLLSKFVYPKTTTHQFIWYTFSKSMGLVVIFIMRNTKLSNSTWHLYVSWPTCDKALELNIKWIKPMAHNILRIQ